MIFAATVSGALTPTRTGFSSAMSKRETHPDSLANRELSVSALRALGSEGDARQHADDRRRHPDVVVGLEIAAELRVQSREGQDANGPDCQDLASRRIQG